MDDPSSKFGGFCHTGSEVMRAWPRCMGAFSPISQQSLDRRMEKVTGYEPDAEQRTVLV